MPGGGVGVPGRGVPQCPMAPRPRYSNVPAHPILGTPTPQSKVPQPPSQRYLNPPPVTGTFGLQFQVSRPPISHVSGTSPHPPPFYNYPPPLPPPVPRIGFLHYSPITPCSPQPSLVLRANFQLENGRDCNIMLLLWAGRNFHGCHPRQGTPC